MSFISRTPPISSHYERTFFPEVLQLEFLRTLLSLLDTKMAVPTPYGPFHVFFIITSIFCGFLISRYCANKGETYIRRFLLVDALLITVLEIYKQINFSFHVDGSQILFDYQWYAFPFQFCSTPMYIGLLAAVVKRKSLHEHLCSYLATYALFAGICVMAYPVTVFIDTIGINIQTMVCHGSMITTGIVLLQTGYVKVAPKTIIRAFPVFLTLVFAAMIMNEVAYQTGLLEAETFNMFFISPYCAPELPVYSQIQGIVPFPFSVLIYIAGFTAASGIIMLLCKVFHIDASSSHSPKTHSRSLHNLPATH